MTISEILRDVGAVKPMTKQTLYTHLHALKIKPVGEVKQRPQHYPQNTPTRILKRLGLTRKARTGGKSNGHAR